MSPSPTLATPSHLAAGAVATPVASRLGRSRPMLALGCALLLALSGAGCPHQNRSSKIPAAASSDFKRFSVLTAKSKERKGFFDTYQKGDDLFIAIPKARLGEKFLLTARIAQGVGAGHLLSGTSVDGNAAGIVSFERYGDRLFLIQHQVRVTAGSSSSSRIAVSQSYSPSVIQSAAIESERGDGAAVINARSWLLGDLSGIGSLVGAMSKLGRSGGSATLNRDRSYLDSVKVFPDNLNLRVRLTFPVPERASLPSVPDDRYLSVLVGYSFARLPAEPMPARHDDDRIGFFTTSYYDLDSRGADPFVRIIHRWRLQPDKPLTYYVDASVPPEYRRYVEAGVLAWQRAFAAAGFPQILRVAPLPKGADPEDIRYPTIRWDASIDSPLGRGESLTDPRSGEIVGASILLSSHLIRHSRRIDQPLLGERGPTALRRGGDEFSALWDALLRPRRGDGPSLDGDQRRRELDGESFSLHLDQQAVLLHSTLAASGALLAGQPLPARVLGQAIQFCTMHEVGHTLGLHHNFKASAAVPNERLADPAWVREHSLIPSIMDYPGLNLPRGGAPAPADWSFYPPDVGESDVLTIQYGYSRDEAQAQAIARQAASRGHLLGTDEDAHSRDAVDPATQTWDLGADSLAWARERAELISGLLAVLPTRILTDNASFGELTSVAQALLAQYGSAVDIALPYIGGQRLARDHVGDRAGQPPYRAVEKARQREAFDLLLRYAFAEGAMALPPTLLAQAGPLPVTGFSGRRTQLEVPLLRLVRSFQGRMLQELLAKDTLLRLRHSEQKHGADATLTLPELFEGLTTALWTELLAAPIPRNITAARRDLQRVHIDALTALLLRREDSPAADPDSRALARYQLAELRKRLQEKEKSLASLDGYTRAHLADLSARIAKVLDAAVIESPL